MSMSKQELESFINSNNDFKALVDVYGQPKAIGGGCQNEGVICMESNCVNHKKIQIKCNKSGGCDDYAVVDCP